MSNIDELRDKINCIDKDMALLFEKRMNIVKEVANYKKENFLSITDENRENDVILKNANNINDDNIKEYYTNFIKNNIDLSKKYQEKLLYGYKIAYSGLLGSYGYIAAKKMHSNGIFVSNNSFKSAYNSVVDCINDIVVLPIENSYAGNIGEVMDLMFFGTLYLNKIYDLEIKHCMLTKNIVKMDDVKYVVSHPQAIMQCFDFIEKHNLKVIEEVNTAVAAKKLLNGYSNIDVNEIAVIASNESANEYSLNILAKYINNEDNNTTRFASLSRVLYKYENADISNKNFIIAFTVKNEAGALAKCLDIIGTHNFNMRN